MSDIKIALDFFDKQGGLKKVVKGLGEIKKLQQDIKKGGIGIDKQNIKQVESLTKKVSNLQKTRSKNTKTTKELNNIEKKAGDIQKDLNNVTQKTIKKSKELKKATDDEIRSKLKLADASKKQKDRIKDELILLDKEAGTLQKLAARNRQLSRERAKLNINTDKGRKRLIEINKQLDINNKKIESNSDKLTKQKINVGNYSETIKKAVGETGLFNGVLGRLTTIQNLLTSLLRINTVEQEVNSAAVTSNAVATTTLTSAQKALAVATNFSSKALKAFKIALVSTGVGAIIVALGSLIAFFTRTQKGIDSVSTATSGLTAGFDVIIDRFSQFGEGLTEIFSGNFEQGFDKIKESFKGIGGEIAEDVASARELNRAFLELTRTQLLFTAEQATSLGVAKELLLVVKNKLNDDRDRLAAAKEIEQVELRLAEKQIALEERSLALSLDAIIADKDRLDFIERIKTGQIETAEAIKLAEEFTLSSAGGEEALEEIVTNIVKLQTARNSLLDKQVAVTRIISNIEREIATKRAKGILEQANAAKEFAKDEDKSVKNRIDAINEGVRLEILSEKVRADANLITELEFQSKRLKINQRAEQEIQKIKDKFLKENLIDFDAINKRKIAEINLEKEIAISRLNQRVVDFEIEKDFEEFKAKELTKIRRDALIKELNLLESIKLKQGEKESDREFKFRQKEKKAREEDLKGQIALLNTNLKKEKDANDKANQKEREETLKLIEDISDASNRGFQVALRRSELRQEQLGDEINLQKANISTQLKLAEQGKENTLAFEKRRAAELQAERIKEQQRQERIQKKQTFFNLVAEFAKSDPNTASTKAVVQLAIAEGIAGTFEDGGQIGDVVDRNGIGGGVKGGIFTGRTHKQGGILIEAQRDEGIFSSKEMKNLGKDNFYNLKNMLNTPINADIFDQQSMSLINVKNESMGYDFSRLENKLNSLQDTVKNKKENHFNFDKFGNFIQSQIERGVTKHTIKKRNF